MDLTSLVGLAGVPLVSALTAWIKMTFPNLPGQYVPSVAIVWGVILNNALSLVLGTDWRVALLVGVVTGLAASGIYTAGKAAERVGQ
jgi:hypothetical protein